MSENANEIQLTLEDLNSLMTTSKVAEAKGVTASIVRRAVRKGELKALRPGGTILFLPSVVEAWTPSASTGGGGAIRRREDGRVRYSVYLLPAELKAIKEAGIEVVDPRERRKARKAAKAAAVDGGGDAVQAEVAVPTTAPADPFASFPG